jgi:hypothetical protein
MITTEGGVDPRWGNTSKELFYLNSQRELMYAEIEETQGAPRVAATRRVYAGRLKWDTAGHSFAVHPDGQRLIVWTQSTP